MSEAGVLIVSHSVDIAKGLSLLLKEVARDVDIVSVGGLEEGEIGTSFELIQEKVDNHPSQVILTFFDLGSAKMNLEMVQEFSEKEMKIYSVPLIEGSYTAAALLQVGSSIATVESQLAELEIRK